MKKDANIEKIFSVTDTDGQPPKELLMPALNELRAQNARKKARKQLFMKFGVGFSAAAVVLIVSLSVILPHLFSPANKDSNAPAAPAPSYYTAAEITQSVGASANTLKIPQIAHANGDPALPESITEYKFADGETAYASISFRRRGRNGIEDVTVTAEFADGVFEEYKDYYALISDGFNYVTEHENGEYIGKCAVVKDGIKFYIRIMCANPIEIEYYKNIFR